MFPFDEFDGRPSHYDRQGNPLTLEQWIVLHGDRDNNYKRVASTHLGFDGGIWISTVWLGVDYNFMRVGPPIIFETMVFDTTSEERMSDVFMDRYSTEEEALAGHEAMVALVQAELDSAVIDESVIHEETGC